MKKTIIAIYGRENEGKSETIKNVHKSLLYKFPNAKKIPENQKIDYSEDINTCISINDFIIGFESQGDPKSRMINENTLNNLAEKNCDIIICASRSKGETVHKVNEIANEFNYNVLWISSFFSRQLNTEFLNKKASENIIEIIKGLMLNQL
ncbi:hypothetical protein [Aureivirga sp. CE67]|uniref:hypothetical protein n=1 Tax=Aureivirga sp. CE67 TaxID=1788983 RepID=UPI0018CBACEA|nr:hypothetical protein [Aureivirga sp. CE67]